MSKKESEVVRRTNEIDEILKGFKSLNLEFKNITKLSESIATKLSHIEDAPVAPSTIRRNPIYREKLDDFMRVVCPANYTNANDRNISKDIQIRELQLQLSKAKKKSNDLVKENKDIKRLLSLRIALEHKNTEALLADSIEQITTSEDESEEDIFEIVFELMKELGSMDINVSQGYVNDIAEDRVIMNRRKFPKFFRWLKTRI
ncbi:hypothetical protein [Paraferrimonas haliotis]|uniref:hypothetical protein n=1 Tax=Paraferrimonas haliotis TaxID=2013866 RepID=UPI000BA9842B|nr:hypothetical protein [Paraferrimonas haliotis]